MVHTANKCFTPMELVLRRKTIFHYANSKYWAMGNVQKMKTRCLWRRNRILKDSSETVNLNDKLTR
jgi:hypothetical protein